jgi:hypothetical protein
MFNKRFASLKSGAKRQKPNSQVLQAETKKFKEAQKERISNSKNKKAE